MSTQDSLPKDQDPDCWSTDGSDFHYSSLHDLLDANSEIEAGEIVFMGDADHPLASSFVDHDDVIELIATRAYDVGGEWAEDYTDDVSEEAKKEMDDFLTAWIGKHLPIRFYQVKNIREYTITAEDLA